MNFSNEVTKKLFEEQYRKYVDGEEITILMISLINIECKFSDEPYDITNEKQVINRVEALMEQEADRLSKVFENDSDYREVNWREFIFALGSKNVVDGIIESIKGDKEFDEYLETKKREREVAGL